MVLVRAREWPGRVDGVPTRGEPRWIRSMGIEQPDDR